jgi:hypothetical protein
MDVQIYTITGFDMMYKPVGPGPNCGRVYLPREWIGKSVAIVLKELPDDGAKHG